MAEQKLALVVDDSKSARLVLKRMLQRHELRVDTVESAADALEYLLHNRPDVIFMDHMMPGMDGFEAVKAIKENPDTATIPILMYTSRGGDLYLGQARALGAVGILPKTVAPAELFESLQRLGLVEERRERGESDDSREAVETHDEEIASERKEDIPRRPHPPVPFLEPGMKQPDSGLDTDKLDDHVRRLLEEQRVELRKDLLVTMESVARQTASRLNRDVEEKLQELHPEPAPQRSPAWPVLLLALLLLASLLWNWSLYRQTAQQDSAAPVAAAPSDDDLMSAADQEKLELQLDHNLQQLQLSHRNLGWGVNQSMQYAYDEIALDNERVDTVHELLERLAASGFSGTVTLATHVGEFCLLGNQEDGFRLPPPELPLDQCEFIGNPVQASDLAASHQSLRFANFSSSTPLLTEGNMNLEVVALPREEALYAYPEKSANTTAQAWNEAARHNNRVLVEIEPAL